MRYLLDTTIVIPVLAADQVAVDFIRRIAPDGYAVSILSYIEVYQGVVESDDQQDSEWAFATFFGDTPILPVDIAVAQRCANVRAYLKHQGKSPRRRAFDLVIAATAIEHDLELVTHNVKDVSDIPGLSLHDM